MNLIFLIGMMGAGKTYWSRVWGEESQWNVADMDEVIEQETRKTISDIFVQEGEDAFRNIEHQTLKQIIATTKENTIIACGGGTPFFHENMMKMKASGCVVYLEASVEDLEKNLEREFASRPKLAGNLKARLTELLNERKAGYEQAHHIIPIKNITQTTFAEILTACTNRHL